MINLSLRVRRAVAQDHHQIASLIFHEANTHRHLDWRATLDWIGSQNFWVLDGNGAVIAALACPEDPPNVGWIRLFTFAPHLTGPEAWSILWETAQAEIASTNPSATVAAIVVKPWFQEYIRSSGFVLNQEIVLLRRTSRGAAFESLKNARVKIRSMQYEDLPAVADTDLSAFGLFWHNTQDTLRLAFSQSIHATVAIDETEAIIGYQISTGNPFGAHLARLGVRTKVQGRGIGSALMYDLIENLRSRSIGSISVNTQADNSASLALYQNFGFVLTGESFPVYVYKG